jgi:hypothetical protein
MRVIRKIICSIETASNTYSICRFSEVIRKVVCRTGIGWDSTTNNEISPTTRRILGIQEDLKEMLECKKEKALSETYKL